MLTVNYRLFRSFIHPGFVTNLVWLAILVIYNTVDHGLYDLSDKIYWIILIWNTSFCVGSLLFSFKAIKTPRIMVGSFANRYGKALLWIMTVCLILAIYGFYIRGSALNPDNFFNGIRQNSVAMLNDEETTIELPFYLSIPTTIASYAFIVAGCFLREKKYRFSVLICIIFILIYTIFKSNKTTIAKVVFFFVIMYGLTHKLSFSKIAITLISFIILMLTAHLLRSADHGENFDLTRMISIYLLSPLPGFDGILNSNYALIDEFHGEYTLRPFIPYLNMFGTELAGNQDPFNLHFWSYTPLPVNVYTVFFSFYVDFGICGIIFFGFLYGSFFSFLWKKTMDNSIISSLIFSSIFYVLLFQFFIDELFTFFWLHFMNICFTIMLFILFPFSRAQSNSLRHVPT